MRFSKPFTLFVLIPLGIAMAYYFFFAANRYVSESVVSVTQANGADSSLSGLAMLTGMTSSSKQDTLYLREYIHSIDMLKTLDQKIALKKTFQAQKRDPLYRLYDWMPEELYLLYYQNRVEIVYDDITGLLKIRAEGFTPEQAQLLSSTILEESEQFVNELSHKMSRQQLTFAESELLKTKERYSNAKNKLLAFQNKYGMFDPISQAQAKASLSTGFDTQLAQKEAELNSMLSYLQESAPQVVTLKSEIAAIKQQMKKESAAVASSSGKPMNALASEFQNLTIDAGFAEDSYKLALTAVEKSRINALQKTKYLAVIQNPPLPEMATYPRRLYNLITLFIVLSILFGIGRLIKATIEDRKY
ncbi:MAG: capsule biosynthesis protein [Sulfuricurvum sp.]|uniref:capsule biosynthesis protein n=1 Tax=Sulfuricurvum sp. TaxID=2025608 RepID=UPI0026143CCB|nr:capsule biosynthesis protein [Sulfuricurvum sp.]MDD2829550.1 capsule biosynthesis protein [Sulfuricurvum sp.]MDD4950482.1 capsule biosynthesis protein [Sulfuricurvum sp.]